MVILLCGKMRVGKDEVAQRLVSKHGFKRLAFADELKRVAKALMDVDYDSGVDKEAVIERWGKTRRQIWQELGEAVRAIHPDVWVEQVFQSVDLWKNVVITDGRYENELRLAKERGMKVVRVTRPSASASSRHPSETSLDKYSDTSNVWDAVVINDGTVTDLYSKVDELVATFNSVR